MFLLLFVPHNVRAGEPIRPTTFTLGTDSIFAQTEKYAFQSGDEFHAKTILERT